MNEQGTMRLSCTEARILCALRSTAAVMIFGLIGLLLLGLVVYVGLTPRLPVTGISTASYAPDLAANPELIIARRYHAMAVKDISYLAANPELIVARRYTAAVMAGAEVAFLAANPELLLVRNFRGVPAQVYDWKLAANPELILVRSFRGVPAQVYDFYLAANPELILVRNFLGVVVNKDNSHLAANPELLLSRLYSAQRAADAVQRGIEADAARYAAMGNAFQAAVLRGIDADAARYAALGSYFTAIQRGIEADAARYAALGSYYAKMEEGLLAANPELILVRNFRGVPEPVYDYHLAANPELITVRQFNTAVGQGGACSLFEARC
jgi:hypothetical protein